MDNEEDGRPFEPEIVSSLPEKLDSPSGLSQTRGGLLEILFGKTAYEKSSATTRAQTDYIRARVDQGRVIKEYKDLPITLASDSAERKNRHLEIERQKLDLANEIEDAKRKAKTAEQADRIAHLENELRILELETKLAEFKARTQMPTMHVDEDSRRRAAIAAKFKEKLGARYTEQEVRAHADRLIAEVKQRAGDGPLSESMERESKNITDAMNDLLNEL
jgi:hypothetical protein